MHERMDWRAVTFDWNRARAFLVTAEEGSLSAAARALGMTQPTLGRQVAALEEELGVTLFERVGRGLQLTGAGTRLLDHVRAMGEAAGALSLAASGQAQAVEGHVAVTASEIYAQWLLPPVIRRLRQEAPGITLEIVATNAIRDLKRREADIAIRNARHDQPDLIARSLGEDQAAFYATPDCLAAQPPIATLADIAGAQLVGFDENANFITALNARGMAVTEANFPVRASSHPVHWELARAGLAIGVVPCALGDADPTMRRVLPEPFVSYPVWLVAHRELRTAPRVRLVWDLLADMLPPLLRGAEGRPAVDPQGA